MAELVNQRKEFYGNFPEFFADFEEANLEYGLYGVKTFPQETIGEINYATEELWKVFRKIENYVRNLEYDAFVDLGYSGEMYEFIKSNYVENGTVVSRFDFIVRDGQIKMIELNNDTPFLLLESFYMNQHLCDEFGVKNPHQHNEINLFMSYGTAIHDCAKHLNRNNMFDLNIVVTGQDYETDKEEFLTVNFINELLSNYPNVRFEDIKDLRVVSKSENGYERGLYTCDMQKIDVLIKPAHPIEFLLDDVASDGERIGLEILKMVNERRLALLNPPSSYILQSKVTMALAWHLKDLNLVLDYHEREIIEKYLLLTNLDNKHFTFYNEDYVEKPVFSREGHSVRIVRNGDEVKSQQNAYSDGKMVYQQFFEMPSDSVLINGEYVDKKYLVGSFIVNNRASGLACRYGNEITEWDSHWMAVGVE